MSNRLFIGNLSFSTTAESLGKLFETVGTVLDAVIVARGQYSRGFGFVNMKDEATARRAFELLNHKELDGRSINIELARSAGPRDNTEPRSPAARRPRRGGRGPRRPRAPVDPNAPTSKTRAFLTNLPYSTTPEQIKAAFPGLAIKDVTLPTLFSGRPSGFGFVEFNNPADLTRVISKPIVTIGDREVRIEAARVRADREAPAGAMPRN